MVVVGRIGRPHGVRGEVTVAVHTDDPDARFATGSVLLTDPSERGPLTVSSTRRSGEVRLLAFEGILDRDAAEALRGTTLQVATDDLPPLTDAEEFYDHQLVGLGVRSVSGIELGVVGDVLHAPAAPVLVVTRPGGATELVPFVSAVVPTVDLAAGVLIVDPPDGMFA